MGANQLKQKKNEEILPLWPFISHSSLWGTFWEVQISLKISIYFVGISQNGGLAGGLLNAALESFAQQGKGREALNLLNVVEGPNVGAYAAAFLSCQQYEVLKLLKCDMMWRLSPNLIKKTCRNRNLWNTTESFFSLSMIWREFWRQSFWFCWDFNTRMECYQCHQCREMDLGVTNQVWQRQKGLLKDGWLMMASAKSENTGDWITVKQCETCLSSADIMLIHFQVKPSKHWLHYIPTK